MDQLRTLSTGAQIVLAGTIAFLIVSFFSWFDVEGLEEATGFDAGVSMWNGIGVVAGLIAVVLLVWQAIRLANINLEIGVSQSMVSAALAVLLLLFAFIRFIDAPTLFDRTIWAWLGLVLAIVVVVGAWLGMQAAGESLDDMRKTISGLGGRSAQAPSDAPPMQETPPAGETGTTTGSTEEGEPPRTP
jgi:hypothetical protein